MKLAIFYLALYFCPILISAQDAFSVKGIFVGASGRKIYLQPLKKTYAGVNDSVTSIDGSFHFKGKVIEPEQYKIFIEGQRGFFQLILENKEVNINGTIDSVWRSTIEGSDESKNLSAFNRSVISLISKQNESFKNFLAAKQSGDSVLVQKNVQDNENTNRALQLESLAYIKNHPDKFSSLSLIEKFGANNDANYIQTALYMLDDKLKTHNLYKKLYERVEASGRLYLGNKAIDFVQNDMVGNPIQLRSFRGKYVLIDFWASWCGPCRAENPNLISLYERYKDKGFQILGISIDRESDKFKWTQAIKDDRLIWPQLSDLKGGQNAVAVKYGVSSIPTNYLIDPNGLIIGKDLRGDKLKLMLAKIFND